MTELEELLAELRAELVDEASPTSDSSRNYGRPHAHPRAQTFPRYSPTGERLAGAVRIPPDCPRPVRGRCECPPDGSWRGAAGATPADATARHLRRIREEQLVAAPIGEAAWVDEVYELGPDGLWRCRMPARRALERLRGASLARHRAALRLVRGDPLEACWDEPPADPEDAALRILRDLARWAKIERDTEYERRPRQWWDRPRKRRPARTGAKSDAQADAEADATA